MEKVIVVGVNSLGEAIATCQSFITDEKLEKTMQKQFDCTDFIVFYEEGIEELDVALEEFYKE